MSGAKPDGSNEGHDESLDLLLQRADRLDLNSDRLDRLEKRWTDISRRRIRSQHRLAVALGLLIGVSALFAVGRVPDLLERSLDRDPLVDSSDQPVGPGAVAAADSGTATLASDESTSAYDRLLCVAVQRQSRRKDGQAPQRVSEAGSDVESAPLDEIVSLTLGRIENNQAIGDLVVRLRRETSEDELLRWLANANDDAAAGAALQLLSHVATRRSMPVLFHIRDTKRTSPELYASSTRIIGRHADDKILFQLAAMEPSVAIRQELAAELLGRSTRQSLFLFLQLVNERRTSAAALAAVRDVQELPVESLLACLSARARNVRLTAAIVLSRSDEPDISVRLVQMLSTSRTRRAAMVALVASDDDAARQFVAEARHDIYLAASVSAAQSVVSSFRLDS